MSEVGAGISREPYIDWRSIVAGAVLASGVSLTLHAFGAGIGLSIMSSTPSWRDSSPWLWMASGVFLLFVALASFAIAGYATGRMRHADRATVKESEFRDGMHGLFAWGLAILLTAVLALAGAAIGSRSALPSGGAAGVSASTAGETTLALELDELFRDDAKVVGPDFAFRRAEAARILLKAGGHEGVKAEDRVYLTNVVANHTAADNPDVRVDRAVARAKDALHSARVAAVIQAFMIAAALFVGAAVAWFSATQGGRDREARLFPVWNWSWRSPIVRSEQEGL